jgi:4-amino-4-deoxy-L-arabinose transferase
MKLLILSLISIFALIYLLPLGGKPMIAPDEFRYAEIPREMIQTGDWVTPRLIGVRYFEKPVMGHWLNAAAILLFGENAFAVRFASALATGISAALIFFLSWRTTRQLFFAWLTTAIFLTSGLVYGIGTFAVLDSPTTLFVTGTLVFFFIATQELRFNRQQMLFLMLSGACCGMAFLTKGFLAFAVPAVTIIPFLLWEKRWRDIFILPWIPLLTIIVIAAPWALMIHQREPDFWRYFFWVEHVQRFFEKRGTQHPEPFWFFVPVILGGLLPWVLLLPCALKGLTVKHRVALPDSFIKFIICWFIFPTLFFSACSGKLATYALPLFPPLALLTGWGLLGYCKNAGTSLLDTSCKILAWALLISAAGFILYQLLANRGIFPELYSCEEVFKWIIAVAAVIIWAAGLLFVVRVKKVYYKTAIFAIAPLAVFFVANYVIPDRVLSNKAQGIYFKKWRQYISPGTVIVAHPNVMHAAAWEFHRNDLLFADHGGELEYGLNYQDQKSRIISKDEFGKMVKKAKPGSLVHIIRGDFRDSGQKADFEIYDHEMMFAKF